MNNLLFFLQLLWTAKRWCILVYCIPWIFVLAVRYGSIPIRHSQRERRGGLACDDWEDEGWAGSRVRRQGGNQKTASKTGGRKVFPRRNLRSSNLTSTRSTNLPRLKGSIPRVWPRGLDTKFLGEGIACTRRFSRIERDEAFRKPERVRPKRTGRSIRGECDPGFPAARCFCVRKTTVVRVARALTSKRMNSVVRPTTG